MTTRIGFVFALGVAMGLAVLVSPAHAENRPSDGVLLTRLNGVVTREMNALVADGGGLTLFTVDAGPGCNNVSTGAVYEMHCNAAGHFCGWNDGGVSCGSAIGSASYGRPVAASSASDPRPYFFVAPGNATAGATTSVCIAPASGSTSTTCALFKLQ